MCSSYEPGAKLKPIDNRSIIWLSNRMELDFLEVNDYID